MALTNTLVNNVCYPSVDSAVDAFYSSHPISLLTSPTDTYRVLYIKDLGVWKQLKQVINSSGSLSTVYTFDVGAPTFPSCDATQPYFDGMQMGWGIVAAMIAVSGVILIRKAFFNA